MAGTGLSATPCNVISNGGTACGGIGVTIDANGKPMTPTTAPAIAVTIIAAGGIPVHLINEDGTDYVP